MTDEKRYIIVTCFKTHDDDEIVLPWDPRVKFVSDDNYEYKDFIGDIIIEGKTGVVNSLLQYYDVNTKTVLNGEIINIYEESNDFKKGCLVVYEGDNHKEVIKSRIKGYSYSEYDSTVVKGDDLVILYKGLPEIDKNKINPKQLYDVRRWSPQWELEDGAIKKHYYIKKLKED